MKITSFIDLILQETSQVDECSLAPLNLSDEDDEHPDTLVESNVDNSYEEYERYLVVNSSQELIKCFVDRYNTRDTSILQLFDMSASFEYISIGQTMSTESALTLLDLEVQAMEYHQDSLTIDYDPNINGFSLFYITFDGSLHLKS